MSRRKKRLNQKSDWNIGRWLKKFKRKPKSVSMQIAEALEEAGFKAEKHIIKITPEGPKVLPNLGEIHNKKFSDKEIVMLFLLGSKIAFELGKTFEKASPISDIQASTNLNPKSISSRLSELVKVGYVTKSVNKETQTESVVYAITTIGIKWLNDIITKKIALK